ncbi:MAG: hypothetical protein KF878_23320 [Planctomycetes bacterium]|nr:hypothetical protein [Planctomycetota bacterium]
MRGRRPGEVPPAEARDLGEREGWAARRRSARRRRARWCCAPPRRPRTARQTPASQRSYERRRRVLAGRAVEEADQVAQGLGRRGEVEALAQERLELGPERRPAQAAGERQRGLPRGRVGVEDERQEPPRGLGDVEVGEQGQELAADLRLGLRRGQASDRRGVRPAVQGAQDVRRGGADVRVGVGEERHHLAQAHVVDHVRQERQRGRPQGALAARRDIEHGRLQGGVGRQAAVGAQGRERAGRRARALERDVRGEDVHEVRRLDAREVRDGLAAQGVVGRAEEGGDQRQPAGRPRRPGRARRRGARGRSSLEAWAQGRGEAGLSRGGRAP